MRTVLKCALWLGCAAGLLSATDPCAPSSDGGAIESLIRAYPQCLAETPKPNTILWKDGTEMVFDDGIRKADFDDLLNRASLKDQMAMPYPPAWSAAPPPLNSDPGRVRNDAFFRKMYGDSAQCVEANLTAVVWLNGANLRFTKVNGASEALGRVRDDLRKLPGEVRQYVSEPIGTFQWRPIAGTNRLSMHSFGAAIDFQLPKTIHRYWKWDAASPKDSPAYPAPLLEDSALRQVVETFERHGFIWGGKWFHYDAMHFEYRPELFKTNK